MMIAFLIGVFCGSAIGVFVAGLCAAAKRGDELAEQAMLDHARKMEKDRSNNLVCPEVEP